MAGNDNPFLKLGTGTGVLRAPDKPQNSGTYRGPLRSGYDAPVYVRRPQVPKDGDINMKGAPLKVRAAVASVPRANDKLAALKKFYPDVRPYGADNFVFMDPKTKQWTIFNPKGVDAGDFVEQGRLGANIVGGFVGGVAGSAAGPAGTLGGSAVGATGGGVLYDKAMQAAFGLNDSRSAGDQAIDAGIETGLNVAIPAVGGKLLKAGRNTFRTGGSNVVQAFERLGGRAPVTASGSKAARMTGGVLEAQLPSSGTMAARNEAANNTIKAGVEKTAGKFSAPATKEDAGRIITDAADKYVQNFRAGAKANYDAVDSLIPPKTRVGFKEFETKVDEINGRFSADPEWEKLLVDPEMKAIIDAVDVSKTKGGVAYGTLKAIRSQLGQEIQRGQGKLIGILGMDDTKMLYGALSKDMETAAKTVAGDTGAAAAKTASDFWKEGRRVIDQHITPIVKNGANPRAPEAAFDKLLETAQKTPSVMREWENVVPVAERNRLGAFTTRELGTARAGAQDQVATDAAGILFSPSAYTTRFNNLLNGPGAEPVRSFFFPDKALRQTAEDAFTASSAMKGAATEVNSSRTGAITGASNLGTSLLGAGLGYLTGDASGAAMGGVLAPAAFSALTYPVAKVLTNPTVERILSRPALDSALPEITSRLSPQTAAVAKSIIGEWGQSPTRNELNADTGAEDVNPFFVFGQTDQ